MLQDILLRDWLIFLTLCATILPIVVRFIVPKLAKQKTPPKREDRVHFGFTISKSEYDLLLKSGAVLGIDNKQKILEYSFGIFTIVAEEIEAGNETVIVDKDGKILKKICSLHKEEK